MLDLVKNEEDYQMMKEFPFVFQKSYECFCLESNLEKVVVQDKSKKIFLPFVLSNSKFLKTLTILHPPLAFSQKITKDEEKTFLEDFIKYATEKKIADRIKFPMHFGKYNSSPVNAKFIKFGMLQINLNQEIDKIFNDFRKNYRYEIKRCQREGVRVTFGHEQFDVFYNLYEKTMIRNQLHLESKLALKQLIKSSDNFICAVSYFKNEVAGVALVPYSKHSGFYFLGGSAEKQKISGALKIMHWEIIKLLKKKGVDKYIMGGIRMEEIENKKIKGINNFKLGFGCFVDEGFLWRKDLKKFKCRVYDFLFFLKHRYFEH